MINTEDYADDFILAKRQAIVDSKPEYSNVSQLIGTADDPYTISLPSDITDPESDPVLVDISEPYEIDVVDETDPLSYPGIKADMQTHAASMFQHLTREVALVNTNTTLSSLTQVVIATAPADITLDSEANTAGKMITILNESAGAVSLLGTIDGISGYDVVDRVTIFSDGTNYYTMTPRIQRGSGSVTSATSASVTFPDGMPDANYIVNVELNGDTYCWITSKTTSGFTIQFPASVTVGFQWSAKQ